MPPTFQKTHSLSSIVEVNPLMAISPTISNVICIFNQYSIWCLVTASLRLFPQVSKPKIISLMFYHISWPVLLFINNFLSLCALLYTITNYHSFHSERQIKFYLSHIKFYFSQKKFCLEENSKLKQINTLLGSETNTFLFNSNFISFRIIFNIWLHFQFCFVSK